MCPQYSVRIVAIAVASLFLLPGLAPASRCSSTSPHRQAVRPAAGDAELLTARAELMRTAHRHRLGQNVREGDFTPEAPCAVA